MAAEILQAEIDRLVDLHGEIRCHHHRLESWPDEGIEHQFADATEFSKSGPKDERELKHVAVCISLRAGEKTVSAQKFGHEAGDLCAAQVAAHRLSPGNPVIPTCAFHGVVALVDQHNNGIAVIGPVSYTHLRAHETDSYLVCRLLLEKKKS